jgi:PAS domain S-box-containing protein
MTPSLFELLHRQIGDRLPVTTLTKSTLVHLSHTLEDTVLRERLPAVIMTGFQESSYWRQETQRYQALAGVARQVCIFAGEPLPPESSASQIHIELAEDDFLRQEWFLLILSDKFCVLLCGLDRQTSTANEAIREFDTVWTFDGDVIEVALDVLEGTIKRYRPDRLEMLREARAAFPLIPPDNALVTSLTLELVRFHEKLNQQLAWEQSLTESLLSSISHQLFVAELLDDTLKFVYLSPNFPRLTGYSQEQLADWDFWMEQAIYPEDRLLLREQLQTGGNTEIEFRLIRADGNVIWLSESIRVHEDGHIYGVVNEITERKQAEAMRLALEKEQEINAIKSYFMATVSHEFRTPLATILSSSELQERYWERISEDDHKQRLRSIQEQIVRMSRMLDDIEVIMSGEIQALGFNPAPVDVHDYLEERCARTRARLKSGQRLTLTDHLPDTPLNIDINLLKHIFNNLLKNAVQYSPEGTEIKAEAKLYDDTLVITVSDQGFGIAPDDRPHVFEAFYRGKNVQTIPGAGLGLKIVQECVQLHHGKIIFESALNRGTTFTVRLPIH